MGAAFLNTNDKKKKPEGAGQGALGGSKDMQAQSAPQDGFNMWLERKLHQMFDDVAAEPLPDNLRKLLAEIEEKEKTKK